MERAQGRCDVDRRMGRYQRLDLDDRAAYIKQRNDFGVFDHVERCRGAVPDHVSTFHLERMAETRHVVGPRPTEPDVIRAAGRSEQGTMDVHTQHSYAYNEWNEMVPAVVCLDLTIR
jgi:hypothetical protein